MDRYPLLDEIRGFAVLCMIFYHAFYLFSDVFSSQISNKLVNFFMPAEPFFAAAFVFISGICTRFSHRPIKRGIMLCFVAGVISLVTFFLDKFAFDCLIVFGIIHLLALSWLLFALFKRLIEKQNPKVFFIIFFVLFLIFYNTENGYLGFSSFAYYLPKNFYSHNYFSIFGFVNSKFFSADYFPILPWSFIFFSGVFFGRCFKTAPKLIKKSMFSPLGFMGRNAIWFYLLHQPLLFVLGEIIF